MASASEPATLPARFKSRPNRFVVQARLDGGEQVTAHLADPGRLIELLRPEAELRLRPAPAAGRRRTPYSVALVRAGSTGAAPWVSLEPARANELVGSRLAAGAVRGLTGEIESEVRRGKSRIDFRVRPSGSPAVWVEVKAVSWAQDGVGRFPDAPTARGLKHLEELTAIVEQGEAACLILAAMRSDIREIRPYAAIDPDWAAAVRRAKLAGVTVRGLGFQFDELGRWRFRAAIPFRLEANRERRVTG